MIALDLVRLEWLATSLFMQAGAVTPHACYLVYGFKFCVAPQSRSRYFVSTGKAATRNLGEDQSHLLCVVGVGWALLGGEEIDPRLCRLRLVSFGEP